MGQVTDEQVKRAQDRAHLADEKADTAGLLLAECIDTGIGNPVDLLRDFRAATAEAHYAWALLSDALDQAQRYRHQVSA